MAQRYPYKRNPENRCDYRKTFAVNRPHWIFYSPFNRKNAPKNRSHKTVIKWDRWANSNRMFRTIVLWKFRTRSEYWDPFFWMSWEIKSFVKFCHPATSSRRTGNLNFLLHHRKTFWITRSLNCSDMKISATYNWNNFLFCLLFGSRVTSCVMQKFCFWTKVNKGHYFYTN